MSIYKDEAFADLSVKRHQLFTDVFLRVCEEYGNTDWWMGQLELHSENDKDAICLIHEILNMRCHIAYHFMENGANDDFIKLQGALIHLITLYNNSYIKESE